MYVPVTDAKSKLTDLIRRAEAGDEIILTRHGQPVVWLAPVKAPADQVKRRRILEAARMNALGKVVKDPSAARSQDLLYGEDGLPE
jgi:prevent-host-death family protein